MPEFCTLFTRLPADDVPGGDPRAAEGGNGCDGNWTVAGENLDFFAAGEDIFF